MKISAMLASAVSMASAHSLDDVYGPGPFEVARSSLEMESTGPLRPPTDTKGDLQVWQPTEEGDYPVLFYMGGFTSPVSAYDSFLNNIASHGFIVAGVDGPEARNSYAEEAKLVQGSMNWMRENLNAALNNGATADLSERVIFGAHSAGNHAMVELLEESCENARGFIMMSPVDGADPFGIVDDFIITPGVKTSFSLPTLHIAAGLDPLSTRPLFPACGPAELSNDRFYDNMNGQIFSINTTAWGHADLITPCVETACPAHPGSISNCPGSNEYLDFMSASSVAFMKGILGGGCDYFDYLTDESTMPIDVVTKNTGVDACPRAVCERL